MAHLIMKRFVDEEPPHTGAGSALATGRIKSINFGLASNSNVLDASHLEVVNRNHYELGSSQPTTYGCLDRRLGTSSKKIHCETCDKPLVDCLGHFGHISLVLPVFHIGYFKETVRVLHCICKTCGRVMLHGALKQKYMRLMKSPALDWHYKQSLHEKAIIRDCKKERVCVYCGAHNGVIKKPLGVFRIIHELRHKESAPVRENFLGEFSKAAEYNSNISDFLNNAHEDLSPLTVLRLFKKVPQEDCILLNLGPEARPEDMIITDLAVPPVCIRPSVAMNQAGSNEDDLTIKLGDIIYINSFLKRAFDKGETTSVIIENWDFLQQQVAMYLNSDLPGFPKIPGQTRKIRALMQRLKGKQGRFRGNLSGKRVDFSGRTVISPDPNLAVDQVGIPMRVAKIMTYPERVNKHNLERLRETVLRGADEWPGANLLELSNGHKMSLKYGKRDILAGMLKEGDIVERHLRDGDIVLFNRQPSLHRVSIMAHKAKILDWRTFRFNECVCTPYNADFDGDEMNIHVPQTEEARTEALYLMGVERNLITPRHGQPLVAATQDFLTATYLLSNKDTFYTRDKISLICCYFNDAKERVELPPPCIVKPMELWTGKQVFSMLLRPNKDPKWPRITLTLKEKNYDRKLDRGPMCPKDGLVVIKDGVHLCGNLCKGSLGGSKEGIIYTLVKDYSSRDAAQWMNRLAKLSARWLGNRGFSVGIDDVTPSNPLRKLRRQKFEAGYETCAENIHQWKSGDLEAAAGLSAEQTLEALMVSNLSSIRDDLGSACLNELDYLHNSPLIMAICGSKGSALNISQMVVGVGQQTVSSQRIQNGFVNRTLPHFTKGSRGPEAKGFVENSFYSGLTGTEFFFHTMGGREGLVDTAVKTAETGYMQRRLVKALEDLCVQYDGSVRDSSKRILQFKYGDDGLDPMAMGGGKTVVDFHHAWEHTKVLNPCVGEECLTGEELAQATQEATESGSSLHKLCSSKFIESLQAFLSKKRKELDDFAAQFSDLGLTDSDIRVAMSQSIRITSEQFRHFIRLCERQYERAIIEPGTAVGAVAAQSIGEPGTQMTLKTFHFAGVASGMNITQGVPRIREIINASVNIKCPVIFAPLVSNDEASARIVKGRVEKTTLGEVAEFIETVIAPQDCYVNIKLDKKAIASLQLDITGEKVVAAILADKKLKMKAGVQARGYEVRVHPPDGTREGLFYSLHHIAKLLPDVVVCGLPNVNRAVITRNSNNAMELQVEGTNILGVMATTGVKGAQVTSNHVIAVLKTLGIEAARATIQKEIHFTMSEHGLTVDPRHVACLADIMSSTGVILGITRFGISKIKDSVLMLASFEKTADHLFDAALRGRTDHVNGVSECIIAGAPIPIGTGLLQLVQKTASKPNTSTQITKPLLLSGFDKKLEFII